MPQKFELDDANVLVIIGSGAGGGTLGNELAQKGIRTVILEAGPRIEREQHIDDERESFARLTWLDKRTTSGSWQSSGRASSVLPATPLKRLDSCSTRRVPCTRMAWRTLRDRWEETICATRLA
jgi:choline dehydrogenase-like flavoprotein